MIRKPSRLAYGGVALVCAAILAACSSSPTLRYITVTPNNGEIYVSAPAGGAIKNARRASATTKRRAAVSPQDITTAVCGTLQYAATGYYSDGTTLDQTSAVTWSSSSMSVATIDNTGLATGVGLGSTNIGATLASVSATTVPLEVDQLNSITVAAVAPVTNPLAIGGTQQFSAVGSFTLASGGSANQDISSQVTWATGNTNVATVSSTGLVTAVGPGSTTVTATSCDNLTLSNAASVTVTGTALVITPNPITAAVGTTVQFMAMENNNGTLQPPQSPVSWSSSATTTASINATTGLAQALSASGTAVTITATEPANPSLAAGTAILTVQAAAARFAYLANVNSSPGAPTGSISSYIVNVGGSTPLAPNTNDPANPTGLVPLPSNPQQVLLHPSGDLLFYIDSTGAVRSNYVNSTNGVFSMATGQVTPATTTNGSGDIYFGVIDPTGRFLYVVSEGNNPSVPSNGTGVLYGFTINHTQPSGGTNDAQLTPITGVAGFNDGTLNGPTWILTDQTGSYLYIVNGGTNTISEYAINQTPGSLGQLTALGNSPVDTTGGNANDVSPVVGRIDTSGHLFVANQGNGTTGQSVTAFTITPSGGANAGELTMIGTGPTPITDVNVNDTISVIANPNGNFLYVLDYGNGSTAGLVYTYGLTASTGVIGSEVGAGQATDVAPFGGMAIDPTGALLLIDNAGANDVSVFTIGSNGAPTATSPATVAAGTSPEYIVLYTAASGQ